MNKYGHLILGFLLGLFLITLTHIYFGWFDLLNYKTYLFSIPIIFLYSLLPDVDLESSTITWFFLTFGIIGLVIGIFFNYLLLCFSIGLLVLTLLANKLTHHRGIIHTEWTALILSLPIYFIFNGLESFCLAFICFQSHLFGDGYILKLK